MMEVPEDFELDARMTELISAAALAGGYEVAMRLMPETTGGFTKLRDKHSRRVAALASEIAERVQTLHAAALSSGKLSQANSPK